MKTALIVTIALIVLVACVGAGMYLVIYAEYGPDREGNYVIEVVDGDTFKLMDGRIIRLLCVDTPEVDEPGYDKATKFLESLILWEEPIIESNKKDKYDRDLAWVYVNNSNVEVFVNQEIVRLGFGDKFEYDGEDCSMMGI